MKTSSFRHLNLSDVTPAAEVISQAFTSDPLCTFMLPNMNTRLPTLRKFYLPYTKMMIQDQLAHGVGTPLKGVAFWREPAGHKKTIPIRSWLSFLLLLLTTSPIEYFRVKVIYKGLMIGKRIECLHHKYASDPHYYLNNIGVLPAEQGRGFASTLLRPVLAQADEKKVAVYTDTVASANLDFYAHFGFRCMEECPIDGTGITVWALRRPV